MIKRNEYWDVVRGIAIMNIVIGHVGAIPRPLAIILNFYHCGIFFFISGALFKEKNADSPIVFFGKKLKNIYLPTIAYASVYILLNNVFLHLNIYSCYGNGSSISPKVYLTASQMLSQVLDAILKNQYYVELLGAAWMVYPIMLTAIFFCIIAYFARRLGAKKEIAISICCMGMGMMGYIMLQMPLILTWRTEIALLAMPLFLGGYLFARHLCIENLHLSDALISCLILFWLYSGGLDISYAAGIVNDFVGFYIASLAGFYLMLYSSKIIVKTFLKRIFAYAGKHSFDIMVLHFLAFKAVNYLDVVINNKETVEVACFPASNPFQFGVMYLLAGMGLPMLAVFLMEKIKDSLRRKPSE